MTEWTLITFDIDGTILHGVGEGRNGAHRDAFKNASISVFGEKGEEAFQKAWEKRPLRGATDGIVALLIGEEMGVPQEESIPRVPVFFQLMEEAYKQDQADPKRGIETIPGVKAALDKLAASERVAYGLVTGNVEGIAWGKMKALGLDTLAVDRKLKGGFGGFGSDVMPTGTGKESLGGDRGKQILKAIEKAEAMLPEGHKFTKKFHVGDTEADINAAYYASSFPIAVTTGNLKADDLQVCFGERQGLVVDNLDSESFYTTVGV